MKILMISNDPQILDERSLVRARQKEYYGLAAEIYFLYVSCSSPTHWPRAAVKAGKRIVRENNFGLGDLITVQDPFFTARAGVRLKRLSGSQLEIQIHTDIGSPYYAREKFSNKIRLFLARKTIPHADHIRVVSERIKKFLVTAECLRVSEAKIEVRPIALDVSKIKNAPITIDLHREYPQFRKIILMASRLVHEKDISTALRTFGRLRKTFPDTGLVIVGSGPEKFPFQDGVAFESWVDRETLFSYYKTADVFLSTSLYEGYGLSMMEAYSAGCPVVATDAGIAPNIARKVCPVGDAECLLKALTEVLYTNQ